MGLPLLTTSPLKATGNEELIRLLLGHVHRSPPFWTSTMVVYVVYHQEHANSRTVQNRAVQHSSHNLALTATGIVGNTFVIQRGLFSWAE